MNKYDQMNDEELKNELKRLNELQDEVFEEREMVLYGTTGLHRTVGHLVKKYEKELDEILKSIEYINSRMNDAGG